MAKIHEIVLQELSKLIPSSITQEIACFAFYDNHPKSNKNVDIVICTENGELKELFKLDVISSLNLECSTQPTYIRIARDNNSKLFYLVSAFEDLYIISSEDKLRILKKLSNIVRYEVNDAACTGQTFLKVICKDDAVPLLLDSSFNITEDQGLVRSEQNEDDLLPISMELKRKLVQAKYTAKCNERTYLKYLNIRQTASLLCYKTLHPNSNNSAFKDDSESISGALLLKTRVPRIKVCNKKMIIMLNVLNECKESLENIHTVISSATTPSLVYTTKLFAKIETSPFWQETNTNILKPNQEYAVATVINIDEIKQNVTSKINLSGCISYRMFKKEYLLPFDDVVISSYESMGDAFDALSSTIENHRSTLIAILAASEKTELCLRHIKNVGIPENIPISSLFCSQLHMEGVAKAKNIIMYKKSPYHVLNGTTMIFHKHNVGDHVVPVTLHTRSQSQVLALLHYIYGGVRAKIIATTPAYKITSKTDKFSQYNEEIITTSNDLNYMGYATSILNRISKILEHLDYSMRKMNESKNPLVLSKVGTYIDLYSGGVDNFKKFKDSLLVEARKGIDSLTSSDVIEFDSDSDVMIID